MYAVPYYHVAVNQVLCGHLGMRTQSRLNDLMISADNNVGRREDQNLVRIVPLSENIGAPSAFVSTIRSPHETTE